MTNTVRIVGSCVSRSYVKILAKDQRELTVEISSNKHIIKMSYDSWGGELSLSIAKLRDLPRGRSSAVALSGAMFYSLFKSVKYMLNGPATWEYRLHMVKGTKRVGLAI